MKKIAQKIADSLLQINAIKLQPANPFTWASGWNSPIYCDNRKVLSFPEVRREVVKAFVEVIGKEFQQPDLIAGVATGAIAHGVLVAEEMDLPFVYVRSAQKEHGLTNTIEGAFKAGQKVLVIEDLVSTGKSSLRAVEALREAGLEVAGMVAIFTYQFEQSRQNFRESGVELKTLSNYQHLIERAVESGYVKKEELETLKKWREDPENWQSKQS